MRAERNMALTKDELRALICQELQNGGWELQNNLFTRTSTVDKDEIRLWHKYQREERAKREEILIKTHGRELLKHFADGSEINVQNFDPVLIPVQASSEESDLFRFSTLLWSVPVSMGYGRRMRFLVKDRSNNKLIGLFSLMDPVFNLRVRDNAIGWTTRQREVNLYHVLDANVLGAVPPYDRLLGGKFIALSVLSNEVRHFFAMKYRGKQTEIRKRNKPASLLLVTTTSALGRSSIYNRLKIGDEHQLAYESVGYSEGWGHFHFSQATFNKMRDWLRSIDDKYADGHRYGDGPNWKMRVIRKALDSLDFDGNSLKHGIKREVFLAPLATNYNKYLKGETTRPKYYDRPLQHIAESFKSRWMIPRSERVEDWKTWSSYDTWLRIADNCGWSPNEIAPALF